MFMATHLIGFGADASHIAHAVNFDGSNDYMARGAGLTGAADGAQGILSGWFRMGTDATRHAIIYFNNGRILVERTAASKFRIQGDSNGGGTILDVRSNTSVTIASGWVHLLASWNMSTPASWLYLNGVDDKNSVTLSAGTLDYTSTNVHVGALDDGSLKLNSDVAELYLNTAISLDLSVQSNREKFIQAGKPAFLGSDGSLPTGTAPIMYFRGRASDFGTNQGGGGSFSTTGALSDVSSSPSY